MGGFTYVQFSFIISTLRTRSLVLAPAPATSAVSSYLVLTTPHGAVLEDWIGLNEELVV